MKRIMWCYSGSVSCPVGPNNGDAGKGSLNRLIFLEKIPPGKLWKKHKKSRFYQVSPLGPVQAAQTGELCYEFPRKNFTRTSYLGPKWHRASPKYELLKLAYIWLAHIITYLPYCLGSSRGSSRRGKPCWVLSYCKPRNFRQRTSKVGWKGPKRCNVPKSWACSANCRERGFSWRKRAQNGSFSRSGSQKTHVHLRTWRQMLWG